jgi:hypothetical protein
MPLFMAQAHLLRARIALSQDNLAAAKAKCDAARELIQRHGYGRAAPEAAVLNAEIACAENAANRDAAIAAAVTAIRGEPYHDERIGVTIDGGWWGLLPRLELLLSAGDPRLADLRDARDAYNAERDAYLAAQEAELEAQWEEEDRALADPDFRRELSEALVRSGYKPLDEMPLSEQRNATRQISKQMREAQQQQEASASVEIPDALVQHIFADPRAQEMLRDVMQQNNLSSAPSDLPLEVQRAIIAALVKQGIIKGETAPSVETAEAAAKKKRRWWPFGRSDTPRHKS